MRRLATTMIHRVGPLKGEVALSIIIVNWNRVDDIRRNVERLVRLRLPRTEIVVVDNGSTDGSAEVLAEIDAIRLILLETNLGPAAARNVGIDASRGRYLLFLDSDALLGRRAVRELLRRMDRDRSLGIVGCRIINAGTRRLDQWIYPEDARTHERAEFDTYSFSAAGAMVRAEALREAGGFWDDLFIYNEEVDLSIRVIRAGYRVTYCPEARVFHLGSPTGRLRSGAYWYYQARNWIWIAYRHYPPASRAWMVACYALVYLLRSARSAGFCECVAGLLAGLRRVDIVGAFPDKLSSDEVRHLKGLKRHRLTTWLAGHSTRAWLPDRRRAAARVGAGTAPIGVA